jgi:hypothetical protein
MRPIPKPTLKLTPNITWDKPKYQPATYGDAEVRGKLRQWKQKLSDEYQIYSHAYVNLGIADAFNDFAKRGSEKGRRRAFEKISKAFGPGPKLEQVSRGKRPIALWSILNPREPVLVGAPDETGLNQNCVTVNYIICGDIPDFFGDGRRASAAEGLWTLELPDHALARVIHRSGMLPDSIIRDAHQTLLGLSYKLLPRDNETRFRLKAGPGCFVCHMSVGRDEDDGLIVIHVRTDTWIDNDALRDWPPVLSGEAKHGERLMDGLLRPRPLCRIENTDQGLMIEPLYREKKKQGGLVERK